MLSHKELLKYCEASYLENEVEFEKKLGIRGKTEAYYGDSLHKYTVELDDYFVIVFRGTTNKFDLINDLVCNAVDFNHTNVHQGFLSALESQVHQRNDFDKPVYITGHSLGGALAILESDRLYEFNLDIREVVTFGSPMVGALSFKEQYEKKLDNKTTRYVNGDDIVPYLPPVKYYHVGKLMEIGKKSSWFNPLKYYRMFSAHKINNYIIEIEKLNNV